jgi:hypothetical protein
MKRTGTLKDLKKRSKKLKMETRNQKSERVTTVDGI